MVDRGWKKLANGSQFNLSAATTTTIYVSHNYLRSDGTRNHGTRLCFLLKISRIIVTNLPFAWKLRHYIAVAGRTHCGDIIINYVCFCTHTNGHGNDSVLPLSHVCAYARVVGGHTVAHGSDCVHFLCVVVVSPRRSWLLMRKRASCVLWTRRGGRSHRFFV